MFFWNFRSFICVGGNKEGKNWIHFNFPALVFLIHKIKEWEFQKYFCHSLPYIIHVLVGINTIIQKFAHKEVALKGFWLTSMATLPSTIFCFMYCLLLKLQMNIGCLITKHVPIAILDMINLLEDWKISKETWSMWLEITI